jgi:hypothetical protein
MSRRRLAWPRGHFRQVLNQLAAARRPGVDALGHALVGHTIGDYGAYGTFYSFHLYRVDEDIDEVRTAGRSLKLMGGEKSVRFAAEQFRITVGARPSSKGFRRKWECRPPFHEERVGRRVIGFPMAA